MVRALILALLTVPAVAAEPCDASSEGSMYFFDHDGDGYGLPQGMCLAEPTGFFTARNDRDTNDDDARVHPDERDVIARQTAVSVTVRRVLEP